MATPPYPMSTQDTFKLIQLYREEELLWNPKHKFHKNKVYVHEAWTRISKAMKYSVNDLKRKKDNLLTTFRLNFRRKTSSINCGDESFEPTWLFYKVMDEFLNENYQSSIANAEEKTMEELYEDDSYSSVPFESVLIENEDEGIPSTSEQNSYIPPKQYPKNTIKESNIELQQSNKTLSSTIHALCKTLSAKQEDDECDLFCKLLAIKLRKLPKEVRDEMMYEIHGMVLNKSRQHTMRDECDSPLEVKRCKIESDP